MCNTGACSGIFEWGSKMRKERNIAIASEEELQKITEYWMHELGMDDWEIYTYLRSIAELPDELGHVEWWQCSKRAVIGILRWEDYNNKAFGWNMVETLVHELLHIKFGMLLLCLEKDEVAETILHTHIEELSRVLVQKDMGGMQNGMVKSGTERTLGEDSPSFPVPTSSVPRDWGC